MEVVDGSVLDLATVTPNLVLVPAPIRDLAQEALKDKDAVRFCSLVDNLYAVAHVLLNVGALKRAEIYEAALLDALVASRINNLRYSLPELKKLLSIADRGKLRAAGDPLPGPGPFTLYRGVAGVGAARRVRGLHWTSDENQASWFATWIKGLAAPTVYTITVNADDVLAYTNGREEREFIVDVPANLRPRRLRTPLELQDAAAA
jgi:hypothetical protein